MPETQISISDPRRSRRIAARLLVVVAAVAVSLVIAEAALRIWAPRQPCVRFKQNVDELQHMNLTDLVVESDPELFWRLAPRQSRPARGFPFRGVISNGQGLRSEHEIPLEKPKKEIRILFLGDSCTFGHGLLPSETFVAQVGQMLRSQFPGTQFECINAGVPGYSLFQGLRFFETQGFRFRPDLVVANFGFNDSAPWDNQSDMDHHRRSLASQPLHGLQWSRLCQIAWEVASRPGNSNAAPRARLTGSEFFSLLARLDEVTRQQGSGLLLLALPYKVNLDPRFAPWERMEFQGALTTYGRNALRLGPESDGVVDLIPILQELAVEEPVMELLFDHVHPTRMLNEHYARAIAAKLVPWVKSRLGDEARPQPPGTK